MRSAPLPAERLSLTDSVLEGIPAGGKEVDSLLGTRLNSLDLATEGHALRIKTWRSHAHDSGMSMRPLYSQRSSGNSEHVHPASASHPRTKEPPPAETANSSITAEERALLERMTNKLHDKGDNLQYRQPGKLSPKELRLVEEILDASMEADDLEAEMEAAAGREAHFPSSYYGGEHHGGDAHTEAAYKPRGAASGEWARESQVETMDSFSEYSVSTVESASTCAALSPSAIKISLTPRGGRSLEIVRAANAEQGSVLQGTSLRSQRSINSTGENTVHTAHWNEQGRSGSTSEQQPFSPIRWKALSSVMEDGTVTVQQQRTGAFSPRSNFSWQPLTELGRGDDEELFPENLMLTEQSDLGLLRNRLAQVSMPSLTEYIYLCFNCVFMQYEACILHQ